MILACFIGLIGLLCLYFEFFLPGGVLALLGVGVLILSGGIFFFHSESLTASFFYVITLFLLSGVICFIALRVIRKSGKKNSFFLEQNQKGFTTERLEASLVGKEGVVSTELKPSGHVRIEDKVYQAVSQGEFLLKGSLVEVVEVKGSHVLVKIKK